MPQIGTGVGSGRGSNNARSYLIDDGGWGFRPGVVGCDDGQIREPADDLPHPGPFFAVPVAAAAEYADDPIFCNGPKRRQHVFQGIRGVRIIHKQIPVDSV